MVRTGNGMASQSSTTVVDSYLNLLVGESLNFGITMFRLLGD